jgi:hypothetical protein
MDRILGTHTASKNASKPRPDLVGAENCVIASDLQRLGLETFGTPHGPIACVWELLAIDHERRSWVAHVLQRPSDPDLAGYLASTLTVNR